MNSLRKKAVLFMLVGLAVVLAGTDAGTLKVSAKTKNNSKEKILVAYFSRADENYDVGNIKKGNTEIVAEMIAEQTGGTLFHIETKKPYPKNYQECTKVAQQEAQNNVRPKLKKKVKKMSQYDTVYLGYPIWYGDMPMAVYTFLESYDWEGKTVIPFCTHAGSGLSGTPDNIKDVLGKKVTMKKGFSIPGKTAQNSRATTKKKVTAWLKEINKQKTTMSITVKGKKYAVKLEQNKTVNALLKMLPLNLKLKRYAGNEYYCKLSDTPPVASKKTSKIKAGHIYYFKDWNAFVINYKDTNISPYKVVHVGEIENKKIVSVLKKSGKNLSIKVSTK